MAGSAPSRTPRARGDHRGRFAIVAARFNEPIVTRLVDGARQALAAAKVPGEAVELHWVPGSFELPVAALHLAATGAYAAVVCVGVVIRGETPHFEHVAREAAAGIRHVALATGVPVTFGVITTYTEEQAWARAGGSVANRGEEAAAAALEMAEFIRSLPGKRSPRPRGGQAVRARVSGVSGPVIEGRPGSAGASRAPGGLGGRMTEGRPGSAGASRAPGGLGGPLEAPQQKGRRRGPA